MKFAIAVHPGEILLDVLSERAISQSALARHLRVDPSKINEICRKRRGISAEMSLKLAGALGTDRYFWFDLQKQWELSQVNESKIKVKRLAA